jgi:hypothetical protein
MNPDPSKLRQQQQQEEQTSQLQAQGVQQEFASAEDLLRFDAAQTLAPESIAERLKDSIARDPKPAQSWWKRWFGKRV